MRCPKCGYNSFDHFDNCKKCDSDLVAFKQNYGIKSVLFPGSMQPDAGDGVDLAVDDATADAAVVAATTAGAPVKTAVAESESAGSDNDDFGFDFMGDSAEEEDLSFDELFEEAPEDEDIEETIEGPKATAEDSELEDDFGFDPVSEADVDEAESDFSFDDDELESGESDDSGIKEDPKRPFDLPESPQVVGAPEDSLNTFTAEGADTAVETEPAEKVASTTTEEFDDVHEHYVFEPTEPVVRNEPVESVVPVEFIEPVELVESDLSVSGDLDSEVVVPQKMVARAVDTVPTVANCVGAFVYDLIILVTVGIFFVVAAEAAMSTQETRLLPSLDTLINLSVPYFLVLFFLSFGYFTLFHFLAGQTPGKMLTGMRVETTEGEPLAFGQAFLRSVGGLLQLLPAGSGYLLTLLSPERRGWNDKLAGTRVVILRDLS